MAQSIGYFQFDNLVKGRIPFMFLNLGVNTSVLYPHIYKMHLDRALFQVADGDLATMSVEDVVANIQSQNRPPSEAIIILCDDGKKSLLIGEALEKAGYINVFVVEGGWQKVMDQAQGQKH